MTRSTPAEKMTTTQGKDLTMIDWTNKILGKPIKMLRSIQIKFKLYTDQRNNYKSSQQNLSTKAAKLVECGIMLSQHDLEEIH